MAQADDDPTDGRDLGILDDPFNDGASYVDAATIALRYSAVALGQAPDRLGPRKPSAPVTARQLRDTMGSLVTGVCVVTAIWEGEDVAMTANSVTSVSLDPPLILVCIAKAARFHQAIVTAPSWGISVLDASANEISVRFAARGRDTSGQFSATEHHRGEVTGVALLDSSVASLECRTEAVYPGGDHSIVVGRVVAAEQRGEAAHPLLFHRGEYRWLDRTELAEPGRATR